MARTPVPRRARGTGASTTRDDLLRRARELFNEHGVDVVGPRELARDLGLSPGNVSYHFPRKQDLVAALSAELGERNAATLGDLAEAHDLADLLRRYRATFVNQYEYRGIVRAAVTLVETDPASAARILTTERERRQGLTRAFRAMVGPELRPDTDDASIARLVAVCSLIARFWLGETLLSFRDVPAARVIDHYLAMLAQALWSPATDAGRAALRPFLDGVLVARSLGEEDPAAGPPG